MSPRSAAAAVARSASATVHAPARTRVRPRTAPTRRRSGAAARPRTTTRPAPRFDVVGLLDRLLRGPAYIAVVGVLLVGIVFFNVDVLGLNRGIAATDKRASELKRENAALTLKLAKLGSSERIQREALQQGLVLPQPGDVRYLRAKKDDAGRALRVMTAPDPTIATPTAQTVVAQTSPPAGTALGTAQAQTQDPQPAGPATTAPTTQTTTPSTTTQDPTAATATTP